MRAMRIMLVFAVLVLLSGTADWHMFGHDPQRTGGADESVEPPLELLWKYESDRYRAIQNEYITKILADWRDSWVIIIDDDNHKWTYCMSNKKNGLN